MVRERINGKLSPRKINVSLAHHIDIKGFDAEPPISESRCCGLLLPGNECITSWALYYAPILKFMSFKNLVYVIILSLPTIIPENSRTTSACLILPLKDLADLIYLIELLDKVLLLSFPLIFEDELFS